MEIALTEGMLQEPSLAVIEWTIILAGVVGVIATLLPLLPIGAPAIRIWDFPREQISVLLAVALALLALTGVEWSAGFVLLTLAVAASLVWQLLAIFPYTPLSAKQVASADTSPRAAELRLLASNVLISNRDASALLRVIETKQPDVVLLLETDEWWDDSLAPLKSAYPYVVSRPQDNAYGMHLFSRIELVDAEIRYLVDEQVPSIRTKLKLPSGLELVLYCVHPQPPPFVRSEQRDAELLIVGKEVQRAGLPAVVAGDLNDVAWSRSTRLFQKISGLLDPRIGRGTYDTFSARLPSFLRWPLDHVFFSNHFHLVEVAVLDDIGSDHFPFFVHLAHLPSESGDKPQAESNDKVEAEKTIAEGRQQASETVADGRGPEAR